MKVPAERMRDKAISTEIRRLEKRLINLRAENEGFAGSAGEWMTKRLDELYTERSRRQKAASAGCS